MASTFSTCCIQGSTPEPPSLKRLRRLLAPRADGTLLVPQEIVDQFGDLHGGGREQVLAMWNAADTCKAWVYMLIHWIPLYNCIMYASHVHTLWWNFRVKTRSHVSSCSQESFIRRCRRKIESINEQDLYAEGEFLSEQDLIEQEYKEWLACI